MKVSLFSLAKYLPPWGCGPRAGAAGSWSARGRCTVREKMKEEDEGGGYGENEGSDGFRQVVVCIIRVVNFYCESSDADTRYFHFDTWYW